MKQLAAPQGQGYLRFVLQCATMGLTEQVVREQIAKIGKAEKAAMLYMYLSLIPEALIVSMLPPEEFGVYYACGTLKRAREQAIFFELDPSFRHDYFRIDEGIRRCVPHEDGSPKRSIYISVYRVLEHVPLDAIKKLYLITQDGRSLSLEPCTEWPEDEQGLHLYQEIAPVHPLVSSTLGPRAFYELIVKTPISLIFLPAVCFVELRLGELAADPEHGAVRDLPYSNIEHLRACLVELKTKTVHAKMVDRIQPVFFPYRMIKNGVFVGNQNQLLYFPMPSSDELRRKHYPWWRSINL